MEGEIGLLTGLGIEAGGAPKGELAASFRGGRLRHFWVALSSAGGAAIVLGLFALLQRQPVEGFKLLGLWGPWPVLALVALALLAPFMSRMSGTIQTAFTALVTNAQQQTQAGVKTADALTRLADQGGRQQEQVERLAIYAAQEFPGVYERLDKQDEILLDVQRGIKGLHSMLRNEKVALDRRQRNDKVAVDRRHRGAEDRNGS
jgi:hypothetical protein